MNLRAMGSGTVSFGLVAIPVKLYSTTESSTSIRFNMIHEACGTRVQYKYYCPTDDELVDRDELVKGYEFAKGQYVLFTKEELDALNPEATNAIEIREFVPLAEVDPIFYEKSYFLGPDKGGAKPYRLLARAMRETERAALAKYAARGKDYLVLLRPYEDGLIMQQLHYPDEIRDFDQVPVDDAEVQPEELKLALQIIEGITSDEFTPGEYEDAQRRRTWELVEKKIEGQEIVAPPAPDQKAQVVDLMEALKASLGETEEKKPAKRAKKKPAAKKKAGSG